MKKIIYLLLVLLPIITSGQSSETNIKTTRYKSPFLGQYPFYNMTLNAGNIFVCGTTSTSSATGSINVNNNILTVSFSGTCGSTCRINLGTIATINTLVDLPNVELGAITQPNGLPTGYNAKIEYGNLVFYSKFYVMGINTSLTVPYTTSVNYTANNFGNIYECSADAPIQGNGTTGPATGNGSISIANNVITLSIGTYWTELCKLKTGQIHYMNISPMIADLELGAIKDIDGNTTAYNARIHDNWLEFYPTETVPSLVTSVNTQFTYNFGNGSDKEEKVEYLDGLGRPMQRIAAKKGGQAQDIITPIVYDEVGRKSKEYLSYADPLQTTSSLNYRNNSTLIPTMGTYYQEKYPNELSANQPNPYSEQFFEASPLNRILEQTAPGLSWLGDPLSDADHTIKSGYGSNTSGEVRKFVVQFANPQDTETPSLLVSTDYTANQLLKTVTKDENWVTADGNDKTVQEFKDKEGRIILKRAFSATIAHDTYYVYDKYGNLTYVIPPAVNTAAGITSISITDLNNYCYQYRYDYRNRLIEKKLPGKQWEYMVYDKLDRIIASGPVFSPFGGTDTGWDVTMYETYGREAYTAWSEATGFNSTLRKTLQTSVTASTGPVTRVMAANVLDNISIFYNNHSFPGTIKLLTVNYYDNYTFTGGPYATLAGTIVEGQPVLENVLGMPTGTWVRSLTTPTETLNEVAYTLYDKKGRAIRTRNKNYTGGYTQTDSKLDFDGTVLYTVTRHKRTSLIFTEFVVKDEFTYTPQDRLLSHSQTINNGTPELIAAYSYDELGQLIQKKVGNNYIASNTYDQIQPLQTIDYTFNIRGWLKKINDPSAPDNDLFTYRITYDEQLFGEGTPLYNGNINQTICRTVNDGLYQRNYNYTYDDLNRLTSTQYYRRYKSIPTALNYNETISYDKTGNISGLTRGGWLSSGASATMDQLTYTYTANQLDNVKDTGNIIYGFTDGNDAAITGYKDYWYDENGNLTKDLNKNIGTPTTDGIIYNHLNLPTKITFANGDRIEYTYDANGIKLLKKVIIFGGATTTTQYAGTFSYLNNVLQFFPHPEGYVNRQANGSYKHVYQYKDHLGNIRMSYTDLNDDNTIDSSEIIKESNYYAFGAEHSGYNNTYMEIGNSVAQKYKYNTKEYQEELNLNWYDYGARNYDPYLGRWVNIDPMSDKYQKLSPYSYVGNNVVNAIDPDGKRIIFVHGFLGGGSPVGGEKYWYSAFVQGAQTFFNDHQTPFYTNYDYSYLTSATPLRMQNGYDYAKENYAELIKGMDKKEVFRFISHSMGGAFAEGMMKYLKERGWTVDAAIHFNAWSSTEITPSKENPNGDDPTITIDATITNDPVQWLSRTIGEDNIPNAEIIIRKKSDKGFIYRHRDLIDSNDFWTTYLPNALGKMGNSNSATSWQAALTTIRNWLKQNPNIIVNIK